MVIANPLLDSKERRTWLGHKTCRGRKITGGCRVLQPGHCHTCFKKSESITWSPSPQAKQVLRLTMWSYVRDAKVIPSEEITKQHHLLVCDFRANIPLQLRRNSHSTRPRGESVAQSEYQKAFITDATFSNRSCSGTWRKRSGENRIAVYWRQLKCVWR